MISMLGRRLIQLVVVFCVVTFFTVFLISLVPGDPAVVVIPFDDAEETQRTAFREDNNLDEPLPAQWAQSTGTRPVGPDIGAALPVSVLLMLYVQVFSVIVAVPMALWAAYRNGKWIDKVLNTTAFGFISLPNFAVAFFLSYTFGVKLGWLPAQGYTRITEDPVEHFKSMVIPVLSLSLGLIAVYMRLLRADLVRTLQEDFILMARSKGISNGRVLWRHALRPSSLTLLTIAGLNIGALIGGSLVVEFLLNIPGMGYHIALAIATRQYIALQSAVAIVAIGFVLINFAIDLLYNVLDPRIRERAA